jgi:hypothetical protein
VQFTDVAAAAGIRFTHYKGAKGVPTILEEAGPGVCVGDFDSDGWPDIYFVNGRDLYGRGVTVRNALYRNNGNGTFTDVTDRAGVGGTGYGLGCVWGDYDNDGHPDLYVTQYGRNVLYRNRGGGMFEDMTAKARVDGMDFGTLFHSGATFFDYDRDGFLDLYVGGYARFLPNSRRTCRLGPDVESSCLPQAYGGTAPVLYHNNRDGTFTNVTKSAGMYRADGVNLSVAAADYDNDGWPDLFVANDGIEAFLYHNEHNGKFKEVGVPTGMALTDSGSRIAAMCLSLSDYDNDGNLDLYMSDFQFAGDHVWRNDGKGSFFEVTERLGIAAPTKRVLSFGGGFFDFDNDGWVDLFIANGHVYDAVERIFPGVTYKQINTLFRNTGNDRFEEITKTAGPGFSTPHLGRGAAFLDFDNDGRLDVVVANNGDPPLLLHNTGQPGNHYLNLRLAGISSNRDALGARIHIRAGGVDQIREVAGGGSYLSQSDLRAHFGVGASTRVDLIEIAWPSGRKEKFSNIAADHFYMVEEGKNEIADAKRQ